MRGRPLSVPLRATGQSDAARMDNDDKPRTLGPSWDHLFLKNKRSEEEKHVAEAKASVRCQSTSMRTADCATEAMQLLLRSVTKKPPFGGFVLKH